jgi:hypothetical protein
VTLNNSPLKKAVREKMLADEIDAAIVQAHHLQVNEKAFLELVKDRLHVFASKAQKTV